MASIGGGARKKEPTPRRSSSRGRTVDYKKMHEGSYGEAFKSESESGEHLVETIPSGASLGSAVLPEVEVTLDDFEAAFNQQDDEIVRMKNEILCLKRDELLLLKRKEADELRRLVAEQKKQNAKLRGKSDCVENESRTSEMSMPGDINIKTLRKSKKLRKKVLRKMGDLGLTDINDKFSSDSEASADESAENLSSKAKSKGSSNKLKISKKSRAASSQSDLSSADSESFVDSDSSSECTKKSKKGKKSGIKAKASDSVRKQQRYPQAHLRYEFVSSNLSFDKLDLNLFVAGELEIISDQKTREVERMGRLNLLKKIMYLSMSYKFTVL